MSEPLGTRSRALVEGFRRSVGVELEAFEKRGRSRSYEVGAEGELSATAVESGWAVRAGDRKSSFFAAGTGELPLDAEWPRPTRQGLWLPERQDPARFTLPAGLDAPLAGEAEARALVEAIDRELDRELPGAHLVAARFEEGSSESALRSSRGISTRARARVATLRLEAERGERRIVAEASAREAREMKPLALARRLADRLLALEGAARCSGSRLLLAAPLVARLVEAFAPALLGREAPERIAPMLDEQGRIGGPGIRILDDGALAGGLLASAADGEGVPCRAVELVAEGRFVRPLLAWWECEPAQRASGCSRRAGYRDLPRRAPTHFYLEPHPQVAVADLLAEADAYLVEAEAGARVDPSSGTFEVEVAGFALAAGRAAGGLGPRRLRGRFSTLFGGARAVGRDLSFVAADGMFGAPSLLVPEGLELVEPAAAQPAMT